MTDLIAAAIRNREKTLAQVATLSPLRQTARQRADELRSQLKSVRETGTRIERTRSFLSVPNFFPTPRNIVEQMIDLAELEPGMSVLEPSAGKGDVASAAVRAGCTVSCVEIVYSLFEWLREQGHSVQHRDFLTMECGHPFDRVLMNPPFERGIDERHIRHAFTFLKPGGRLVAVACSTTGTKLQGWADQIIPLPAGSFAKAERSTNVNTCIVIKNK